MTMHSRQAIRLRSPRRWRQRIALIGTCCLLPLSLAASEAVPPVLAEALANPDTTTRLDLGETGIERVPAAIGALQALERLDLGPNEQLRAIDPAIGQLQSLTHLSIGGTVKLHELPESIGQCRSLRFIGGWPTGIARLPESIGDLSDLEELRLSGHYHGREGQVGLETLPESIGRLQKLRILRCDHQRLTGLPETIGDCAALEQLLVEGPMTEVPASLTRLHNLRFLGLSGAHLDALPDGLIDLPALQSLLLTRIDRLPEDWSASRLRYLRIGNRYAAGPLTELPEGIADSLGLEAIDVVAQRIEATPASLERLASLRILDLGYNRLQQVPSLPEGLRICVLAENRLTQIPEALANCGELAALNLAGNPLADFDLPWERLASLRILVLDEEWHQQVPREHLPNLEHLWTAEEWRAGFQDWFHEALPELRQVSGGTGVAYR